MTIEEEVVKQRASPAADAAIRVGLLMLRTLSLLPYPLFRRMGEAIGKLAWYVAAPRRRVTMTNLRLCLPSMTERERRRLGRQHFAYFVRAFFDRFIIWFGSEKRIRRLVTLEGIEHYTPFEGRPVIFLAPHFCGIDAGGTRVTLDYTVSSMYANQKSQLLTDVMTQGRMRFKTTRMFLRNDGLRAPIRSLRDGVPFYFLPDMDLGARDALFVPFFGVPAATVTSVARLAKMTKAKVIPVVTTMTPTGYNVRLYPAWPDYPGDDIEAATRYMNAFIEQRVLEMPAQYLWSHKRFKTRPPGEASFYGNRR